MREAIIPRDPRADDFELARARPSLECGPSRVVAVGSGTISESDVMLAVASKGIVIGFNAKPDAGAKRLAEQEKVEIRQYSIIYNLIEALGRPRADEDLVLIREMEDRVGEEMDNVSQHGPEPVRATATATAPRAPLAEVAR